MIKYGKDLHEKGSFKDSWLKSRQFCISLLKALKYKICHFNHYNSFFHNNYQMKISKAFNLPEKNIRITKKSKSSSA